MPPDCVFWRQFGVMSNIWPRGSRIRTRTALHPARQAPENQGWKWKSLAIRAACPAAGGGGVASTV